MTKEEHARAVRIVADWRRRETRQGKHGDAHPEICLDGIRKSKTPREAAVIDEWITLLEQSLEKSH